MQFKVGDKVILKREACLAVGIDSDNCPTQIIFKVYGGNYNYCDCSPNGKKRPIAYHIPSDKLLKAPI